MPAARFTRLRRRAARTPGFREKDRTLLHPMWSSAIGVTYCL